MTDPPARPDKSISDIRRMTKGKAGVEPRDGETMLEAITSTGRNPKRSRARPAINQRPGTRPGQTGQPGIPPATRPGATASRANRPPGSVRPEASRKP